MYAFNDPAQRNFTASSGVAMAKFLAAAAMPHKSINKVEVWNLNTFLMRLGTVTAGNVQVDDTRAVRRTCSLTIATEGYPADTLVPASAADLLHPGSGNELRVFRGIDYQDGTYQYVPCGVFRMSKPKIVDTGSSLTIAVTGQDRSSVISRVAWQGAYQINGPLPLDQGIAGLLANRMPAFPPLNAVGGPFPAMATQIFGSNILQSNNPWTDATGMAQAGGCELFYDVSGYPTLRVIIDPTTAPVVASFVEGPDCTMTEVERTFDETNQFNGAICIGNGSGNPNIPPVLAEVWDTDPTSPTYYLGPWGMVPYIFESALFPALGDTLASTQAKALAAAQSQFQLVNTAFDDTQLQCVPNAALAEGDCINLQRARMRLNSNYVISTMTIPLDVASTMETGHRPRRAKI